MDHDLLIRIDERTEQMMKDIQSMKVSFGESFDDHEARLRVLERSKWAWGGAISIVAVFASYLLNTVISAIKNVG